MKHISNQCKCRPSILGLGLAFGVSLSALGDLSAAPTLFPPGAFRPPALRDVTTVPGMINVRDYGAIPNDQTDDTAAIQKAISDNLDGNELRVIYFPSGTYRISNTLEWRTATGAPSRLLTFQGQDVADTILRLVDDAPGFGAGTNKAVIKTNGLTGSGLAAGSGNTAFKNYIRNLTIHTGDNAGAVGIDFLANNRGGLIDVTVTSGLPFGDRPVGTTAGIRLDRQFVGPMIMRNVIVNGFDFGVATALGSVGQRVNSITCESLTVNNQRVAGVRNVNNVLTIRRLRSTNTVVAVQNASADAVMTLLDAGFALGQTATPAIDNSGTLYLRGGNASNTSYQALVRNRGQMGTVKAITGEFLSDPLEELFAEAPNNSMNLPISETPLFHDNTLSNWGNVLDHGANPTDAIADTAAIQAAFNSGKSTIYFPTIGRFGSRTRGYIIDNTIRIPGTVRRILGLESHFLAIGANFNNAASPRPMFRVEGNQPIVFDQCSFFPLPGGSSPGVIYIEHASSQPLTLKNCSLSGRVNPASTESRISGLYRVAPGITPGALFIEDVDGAGWRFTAPGQKIMARQMNPEFTAQKGFVGDPGVKVTNQGADLCVLGLKTESRGTAIDTRNGGRTEVLGCLLYRTETVSGTDTVPAFNINQAEGSFVFATTADRSIGQDYAVFVQETRGGTTRMLRRPDVPVRGFGVRVSLFSGWTQ